MEITPATLNADLAAPPHTLPRVAVMGGDSALGRAVLRALRERGAARELRVWISPRSASSASDSARLAAGRIPARVYSHSMRDRALVARVLADVDIVYHCQAPVPARILGLFYATIVLLDAARAGRPHIVYPGSPWVAGLPGDGERTIRPGTRLEPRGHTAREMFRIEHLLLSAREMWSVPSTIVRVPDMVGPGCDLWPWGRLWDAARNGRAIQVPFATNVPREWIHVDDAARAMVAVGTRAASIRADGGEGRERADKQVQDSLMSVQEICASGGGVDTAYEFACAVAHSAGAAPLAPVGMTGAALTAWAITDAGVRALLPLARLYGETVRMDGRTAAALGYHPRITRDSLALGHTDD